MRYLGIDQSLTGTGLCIIDDEGKVLLLETIKQKNTPKNSKEEIERLKRILTEILDVVKKEKPDHIAMEDYGFMTKGRSFKLGELGGIIKLALYERGTLPHIFKATSIKKFITGKGNAEKNLVLMNVFKKYGVECKNDNEADAFVIAQLLKETIGVKK